MKQFFCKKSQNNSTGAVLKFCINALLATLLLWQQTVLASANQALTQTIPAIHLPGSLLKLQPQQNAPFKTAPFRHSSESPFGFEQEEDAGNDLNLLAGHSFSGYAFHLLLFDCKLAQPAALVLSRVSIPFFILYHSWKSFLS